MQRPLGAQISHMLKDRGVEVIFGIPGVHNQEMYRGIEEAGLRHVLARHEQGAGFMADGYARASGRPGVCYVISGPGVTNALTPLGQAYSDSVPVLALASCLDETAALKGQLHQMKDQRAAAGTVCDWSEEARTADAAYALIDRALTEFATGRPRPKAIHCPIAALEGLAPPAPMRLQGADVVQGAVDPDAVAQVASALRGARRPVFVIGGGAGEGPYGDVLTRAGAAAFTTYAGRGSVVADHPMLFGSMLARPDSARVMAEADLLVVAGSELAEVDLWRRSLGHDCPMIRVDIDPSLFQGARRRGDMEILGRCAPFFAALCTELAGHTPSTTWDPTDIAATRQRWRAEINAERPGIIPVAEALREALPERTMIYSDMTQFAYAAKEFWDMDAPGHWHHPTGFGTLGYAMPAAIGGAVARKGQPTLAIAGDYGFQYTLQELGTAVELGLNLPIVIWDNGKLGEIEDSMVAAQIAPNAVVQRNPDFCKLAEAYGARAARPDRLADIAGVIAEAFAADCPTIVHLRSDLMG